MDSRVRDTCIPGVSRNFYVSRHLCSYINLPFSTKKKKKNLRYDKLKENSNSTILENTIRELHLSLARYFSYFISID